MTGPELDVRWRRFSLSAKGREAIDAVRKPLFVLLLLNGAVTALAVITALVRPEWSTVTTMMVSWIR